MSQEMGKIVGMMTPRLKSTLWSFKAKKGGKIWHGWTIEVLTADPQGMPIVMHTFESHKMKPPMLFKSESQAKTEMGKWLEEIETKIKNSFTRSALL